jgi:Na+/H+ antiporter NhaD/arsenite permease-like protein
VSFTTYLAIPIIGFTLFGIAVGEIPGLKMNRTTIALAAAVLLVALGIISPSTALGSIDPGTLLLLFAMMVISAHLRLAGFFTWASQVIIRRTHSPQALLAWVIALAGILSALFMNDTVAVLFTPLVLDLTHQLRRAPLPYLLGLATAANIGSAATITGNPQNILIGLSSHISFGLFLSRLAPVALVGLALAWVIIVRLYRSEFREPWALASLDIPAGPVDRGLLWKTLVLTVLMMVAFLAGISMPLVAILAATALLISRRTNPEAVFTRVDWSLLVFFASLFIVTGALQHTAVFSQVFSVLKPWASSGAGMFAVVTAVLSNLVSNVPAVLLFRPVVGQLANPTQAWLVLAMSSTLAGNLTLLGSVANLIVAEAAAARGVKISFREYLRAGIPITLLTILAGVVWLGISS